MPGLLYAPGTARERKLGSVRIGPDDTRARGGLGMRCQAKVK
jgi:hypothetical protein